MEEYVDITYEVEDYNQDIIGASDTHLRVWKAPHSYVFIDQDDNPWDPRDWDNLGHMICFYRNYDLGDEHKEWYQKTPDDLKDFLTEQGANFLCLPLYVYEHGGITMSYQRVYPYNDRWDSSMVGFIYVTYPEIRENWGVKRVSKKLRFKAYEMLKHEVDIYDEYLRGNVYGFTQVCDGCGETIDSCWGFYGDDWKTNGLLDQIDLNAECEQCQEINGRIEAYVGSSVCS